jgi:hypothetical protein
LDIPLPTPDALSESMIIEQRPGQVNNTIPKKANKRQNRHIGSSGANQARRDKIP